MTEEERYAYYLKERDRYIDIGLAQAEQYDKNMLLLSSGAFGVSFAFIDKVVHNIQQGTSWALLFSWAFMALCILNTMVSFLVSQSANMFEATIIDTEFEQPAKVNTTQNQGKRLIPLLNVLGLILFSAGLIFMLLYVKLNLN